jgi:FKBP-type peptidyl-prolyl cis-trans isomerase FklB
MKSIATTALTLGFLATALIAADKPAVAPELKDNKDKAGYAIGLNIGRTMKRDGVDINPDAIALGVRDALAAAKQRLTDEELAAAMDALQKDLMAKRQAQALTAEADAKKAGDKNKKAGDDFLAANKKKEGVKTTASGLQYKVIKDGNGKSPKATDTVSTHYRGTLIDGTEFDSSYKRNEPTSFPVNRVIKGWTEALQLMKEGSKWQLFIPSELAYGANGAGELIGPNSTLVFEVELLKVQGGQ